MQRLVINGQAAADESGNILLKGGRLERDADGSWCYAPGSITDIDIRIIKAFFADLRPNDGPVDITFTIQRV